MITWDSKALGPYFTRRHPHPRPAADLHKTEPISGTSCGESTRALGTGTGHLPSGPLLPPGSGGLRNKLTHAAAMEKAQPKHPGGQCHLTNHQRGPVHTKLWLRRSISAYLTGLTGQSQHLPDTPFSPMSPVSPGPSEGRTKGRTMPAASLDLA